MKKIKVLIVDDHLVIREGLSAVLQTKADVQVVGDVGNGQEAVEKARQLKPDVILMDISMPVMDGVEATRIIRKENPDVGIVVLTMHEEEEFIFNAVKAGATGYLLKDSDSAQIVKAIRAIYDGESLIHPSVATKILAEFSQLSGNKGKPYRKPKRELTTREIGILQMVAEGKTNKEIASDLNLSEKTIKNHIRNIFHKLQVVDRTQAAFYALRKGLIKLNPDKEKE